jgi:hypothetical protein
MKKFTVVLSLFAILLTSLASCVTICNSSGGKNLENIKKIHVRPFANNTNQFGLEVKFTKEVMEEIIADGRLSLVNTEAEADGIVVVTIGKYILRPLAYDAYMQPEKYKLLIAVSVSLVDKDNGVALWTEPNMEVTQTYKDSNKNSADVTDNGMTEEEARQIIWEKMSRKIVKRVVKWFKSASSKTSA